AKMAPLNTAMQISATLNVDDFSVLVRSTKTKPDAAHGMDEGVRFISVYLPAEPPNIDVDDVCHRIEVQVPDVLQQQRARDDLPGVTHEVREQLELLRQQLDYSASAVRGAGQKVHLQ